MRGIALNGAGAIALALAMVMAGVAIAQQPIESAPRRRFEPRPRGRFDPVPPILPSAPLPGAEPRHPHTDVYLAIQYGVRREDVVYLHLNSPKAQTARDLLRVYRPTTNGIELIETPRGTAENFLSRVGSGLVRGRVFRLKTLDTSVDEVRIRSDLTLVSGYRQWDALVLDAVVTMESPAGRASYRVGGSLHSYVALAPSEMKPLGVVAQPRFRVGPGKFDAANLYASLILGDLPMMPGAGMGREVRVTLTESGTGRVRNLRARWEERPYLGIRPFETLTRIDVALRPGTSYQVRGELDLGAVFGTLISETVFTVPAGK